MSKYEYSYVDRNGVEINEGDMICTSPNAKPEKVYLTDDNQLGTDATNPSWIESGRAVPCEYGIYPFEGTILEGKLWVDCEIVK